MYMKLAEITDAFLCKSMREALVGVGNSSSRNVSSFLEKKKKKMSAHQIPNGERIYPLMLKETVSKADGEINHAGHSENTSQQSVRKTLMKHGLLLKQACLFL